MLTALAIRDVVLIEALELDFGGGLGVLTGETGAGKSILLDALGLALGDRADSGLVRQGAAQAVVTASFDTPHADGPIAALLADNGFDVDPGEPLIVRRIVKADGGSRGFVNDQPASAGLLRDLAQHLVEVHGQHDDRGLLAPARASRAARRVRAVPRSAASPRRIARGARPRMRWRRRAREIEAARARPRMARACRRRTRRSSRPSRARRKRSPTAAARCSAPRRSPTISPRSTPGSKGRTAGWRGCARRRACSNGSPTRIPRWPRRWRRSIARSTKGRWPRTAWSTRARRAGVRSARARGGRDAAVRPARDGAQASRPARRPRRSWPTR